MMLASDVTAPTLPCDCTYVPEQPMKEQKAIIWGPYVLIPFFISGNVHAFLGSLPGSSENLTKEVYPCYH